MLWISSAALAQGQRGSIGGTITDPSGAVLPGVEVIVENEQTGSVFKTISSDTGAYLAPQLLPGFYRVTAELTGFKKLTVEHVQVNVGQIATLDLRMQVGSVSEVVEVLGETPLVNTESGSIGHVVQNQQIMELPLNGRNVFDLVNLTPASFRIGGLVSIAGGRTQAASAMLDGVFNSRGGLAIENIEVNPPVDSMQEFKVQANNMSAEFGRTSAGLVNATTKTGTNELHGSLYEFLRNDAFDSQGWGVDVKAPLKRNNFGGTLGGPFRKNKTFF
ncbi:MAG TPA: carboxypeptidase-like regulatory domain-containing protein, partial [Acidobacteriota bacterium]|nr:carboxypeptidase-like regulatory domain-containing protein [Acidobacteriota bacterium]